MTTEARSVFKPRAALESLSERNYSQTTYSELVKKVTRIVQSILGRKPASVSDLVANHEYTNVDISWATRSVYDNDLLTGGERQTTLIPAIVNMSKAFEAGKKADKIGDETGVTLSRLDKAGSGVQMGYALSGIAGKVTSLWSAFRPNPTVAAVGTVLGKILGYLAIPLYVVPALSGAYQAYKAREFHKSYKSYNATFKFLVEHIYVQRSDIENLKYASCGNTLPNVKNFRTLAEQELQAQGLDTDTHFDEAIEALGLAAYEEYYLSRYNHDQENDLSVIGLLLAIKNKQEANETEMARAFGSDCVDLIKKSAMQGLEARLEAQEGTPVKTKADAELEVIRAKIEANYTKIQRINVILSVLSTLTVVLGCIAVALLIANPIGMAVAWTLLALVWVVFDIYLAEQFEGRPGKYDKLLLKILTAVVVIGGALSITGAAIAGAPVTLALAIVLFLLLLGYSGYTFHKIYKLEAKWLADHPTLQDLHKHLADGKPEARALFKKLSKVDRENITDQAQLEPPPRESAEERITQFLRSKDKEHVDKHIVLFKRAAARATHHYWTVFGYRPEDIEARERALRLQAFRHALEAGDLEEAQRLYRALSDPARETLHTQITRVFNRDSSPGALKRAVERQLDAETTPVAS